MNIRAKIYGGVEPAEEPLLQAKKRKGAEPETLQSVAVPRHAKRATNDRGQDRHRLVGERAVLLYKRRKHEVELINLSGGGAMVEASFTPKLWDRVELRLGQHGAIECVVRWIRNGRLGLEFAHETRLDWPSNEVSAVLRQVIERSFPDIHFQDAAPPARAPAEPSEAAAADDNRTAKRHPLIWSALLHHDYQTTKVRVRNLSRTGAMIESPVAVRVGAEPLVEISDHVSVSATVLWAVGDQVGLRFHSPLDMNALVGTRPDVVAPDWKPPSYLDLTARAAADGKHWDRLSLPELRSELEGYLKR